MDVAQAPEVDDWYHKRPPLTGILLAENVRPAYRHRGDESPLLMQSAEDQVAGKGWRYATKEEAAEYAKKFISARPYHAPLEESIIEDRVGRRTAIV